METPPNPSNSSSPEATTESFSSSFESHALSTEEPWLISVKTVGGGIDVANEQTCSTGEKQFTIRVSPQDHLDSLYDQIEASTGLKASQQRLIYRGRLINSQSSSIAPTPPAAAATNKQSAATDESASEAPDVSPAPRIRDIAGLADGQTIHLVKRREPSESENTIAGASSSERDRFPSTADGASANSDLFASSSNALGSGSTSGSNGLLATLLGLSSLSDESEESGARRWPRTRAARSSSRRQHYRMTAEDRHVPDPGSLEPVRQGLMTLHTLLPHMTSTTETPLQSNREWYRGQWLDCLDTVNAWLEATVVEILQPDEILPEAYATAPADENCSGRPRQRDPRLPSDPAVSASDLDGRRRLLLEHCDPADPHNLGGELAGFRPRPSNRGVQLLLIHYNGWPHRWDEWIRSDSGRLRPFRTRTRHPTVSSTASPTPQAVFHEAPRTNILPHGNDEQDRMAVLPEIARSMAAVNEFLQRQVSNVNGTANETNLDPEQDIAPLLSCEDLPWTTTSTPPSSSTPTPPEDLVPPSEGETTSNILRPYESSESDNDEDIPENSSDSVRGNEFSVPLNDSGNLALDEDNSEEMYAVATSSENQLTTETRPRYNRSELQNLATLFDRLGRTLTDAAPHVAALAASLPSEEASQDESTDPEDEFIEDAVEQALEEIAGILPQEAEGSPSHTPIGGLLSLWSRERRRSTIRASNTRDASSRLRRNDARTPRVDPDHEDYVSGLVNTTRGEVRTGPRGRSSNDDVANLLGAYLAAATLGNASSGDEDREEGSGATVGLGQLLRGGAPGGPGAGIDIHIHAVVTGPGGPGAGGIGLATPAGGAAGALGGIGIGGTRNIFSNTNRRAATSNGSILRTPSRASSSFLASRRRINSNDEEDTGIFSELYSENPEPIDPNGSPSPDERDGPIRDVDIDSDDDDGDDYIIGLNESYRSGSGSVRSFRREAREFDSPSEFLSRLNNQATSNNMDPTNVGAASMAGRGVSSTRRRAARSRSFLREAPQEASNTSDRNSSPRRSAWGRIFRRRSSRSTRDQHS
mmetsp:Transcript_44617/g.128945  ORF Transcript_44617/g.128945 Transcript_44617/m.128945 type:complete len:1045 (+) Transcript_44617:172-3306(+)|eukprot:CAMPEP_0176009538 /NCGR_PEP_ID=MMETSP0120_2-20121206/4302_1 /TAXON_ID=160619 /ORGANISM="Kryptoperidinium foliaceum, Strain CCMP 1326" /LENGTH=1044 /DNA_ID=CAMNT_0017342337 /DNA_START=142 /DNA_END=3273 /DNA_ORIENTATION=-